MGREAARALVEASALPQKGRLIREALEVQLAAGGRTALRRLERVLGAAKREALTPRHANLADAEALVPEARLLAPDGPLVGPLGGYRLDAVSAPTL